MKRIVSQIAGLGTVLVGMVVTSVGQPIPQAVNYQGRLVNLDGSPFPTADYELSFAIYDAPTNGIRLWGPQVFDGGSGPGRGLRIPVVQGYFSAVLGPVDVSSRLVAEAFGSSNRYVEVTVSNRPPIRPRQQILASAYAFEAGNGVPPGTVIAFASPSVPPGWLPCDGQTVERDRYPRLWAAIGAAWGPGNANTTFHLPDLRGVFLRGVNGNRTDSLRDDPSDRFSLVGGNSGSVGSFQMDAFKRHSHTFKRAGSYTETGTQNAIFANNAVGVQHDRREEINEEGHPIETRPKNAAVNYIIKY